jgi:pimeloyl-ACP methyl ester carboxylesterase
MLNDLNDLNFIKSVGSRFDKLVNHSQDTLKQSAEAARTVTDLSALHIQKLSKTIRHDSKKIENLIERSKEEVQALKTATLSDWLQMYTSYVRDSVQRQALVFDALRKRGNVYTDHIDSGMPPVLDFQYEVIVDGKDLNPPVNYLLLKITPPAGVVIDPKRAPVLIIDPRAGHGAGIGGSKPDSQVGDAFDDGHQVYFCAFRPMPEPSQTIANVRDAEIFFLGKIAEEHPHSPKPILVGNCQGGWAAMLVAAKSPELVGPIVLNGSPMSYWAGKVGENPMRYTGGLRGGSLPALLMADLGNGLFDGAALVQNFESLNPANSFFKKYYNLYAHVDTEAERFIEFERWWGGFCFMTEAEIRWIVENLFIGNKLASGEAILDGERVDLKKIESPIIVFASHGDNITPPQQALNWIPDLYSSAEEIKALGHRIVYMLHDSIGHLGIFVSSKIAGREHEAITDTVRAIEALSPGLYEMILEDDAERVHIRFEPRNIDNILLLDQNRDEEPLFAEVARMSKINSETYQRVGRPLVKALTTDESAQMMRNLHPLRTQRLVFSDKNPFMPMFDSLSNQANQDRVKLSPTNPFLAAEKIGAEIYEMQLNLYRDVRDAWAESCFFAMYTSPISRAIFHPTAEEHPLHSEIDVMKMPEIQAALANIEQGGLAEACVRMLHLLNKARGYVRRTRLERELQVLKRQDLFPDLSDQEIKKILHQQSLIVDFDQINALATLPLLLKTPESRQTALDLVMEIAGPREKMHAAALKEYGQFELLLS